MEDITKSKIGSYGIVLGTVIAGIGIITSDTINILGLLLVLISLLIMPSDKEEERKFK